jgi:serine/threonine-protein kinase
MSGVSWIPHIDSEFAGYRLVSLLGHGGMSIVYRAEHVQLERLVALKLLSPDLSNDDSFRERFTRESRVAAGLDHPSIIPIFEAGEENGLLYIAMRYVDGPDLKTKLKSDGPLAPEQVISLVAQIASALDAAHAKALIHRDVKPANILIAGGAGLEGSDHYYLSDFGVAKSTASGALTKTGMFVGTADYAAPEQIEGKELDARADVYSLGCVAYEALTGARAYDRDSEVAMMYAHLLEPPPKLTEKRPDLPDEIDEVIATALAKSRDDRYATAGAFAGALRNALEQRVEVSTTASGPGAQETVLATARPVAGAAAEPVAQAEPEQGPPSDAKARGRPKRLVLAGVGGLAVLLAAAVLIPAFALSDDDSSAEATTTSTDDVSPSSSLIAVLAPTQIAKDCTLSPTPSAGAVETYTCTPAEGAPTSQPNAFELSFYAGSRELERAYQKAKSGIELGKCGATTGEKVWVHAATGKRGGRRFCFTDDEARSVVVWTHEKLGADDHADMLGIAREPGRAPTIFTDWWGAVNDIIGKCRAKVSEEECFATIEEKTGSSKLPS